ncbi:hypothetical protein ABIE26_005171 [Pedobacter africanus]|uniref:Uncharacterized protein n=1 Tax=Pedobacter africanus TaxID=151894 RepID=A0ACC6L4Q7_9SPHI|nr:hypothetical protein [Pedobacter africanus]MDR6786643.1 hypothetical protein [Pedobacter africanus]
MSDKYLSKNGSRFDRSKNSAVEDEFRFQDRKSSAENERLKMDKKDKNGGNKLCNQWI